mmetsp:Transcript_20889/g.31889  ORF Transcript_20889/g.31889 Transcript_20889/m.31889 type:complete len:95 (-) Transcript_20889:773-1057(-)
MVLLFFGIQAKQRHAHQTNPSLEGLRFSRNTNMISRIMKWLLFLSLRVSLFFAVHRGSLASLSLNGGTNKYGEFSYFVSDEFKETKIVRESTTK